MGYVAHATPQKLAHTLLEADRYPHIAFLSGCRTGESSYQRNMLSFSEQVVKAGVPVVLGWALPVGDAAASQVAAALYKKLATGFDIPQAVAFARQQLHENRSPYWHLLRCYVDASPLKALVDKGRRRVRRYNTQQQFMDAGGRVRVCARTEFVGRRRLLQRCLRTLRTWYGETNYAEGVLLNGMGGLGKSSAAARLIDRLRGTHEPVVCYGGLDETVLIGALGRALPKVQTLLNDAERTLEQRLRNLFDPEDNPYCGKPLLLVFDDFEQNIPLELRKQGKAQYIPASLTTLHTALRAIHDGQSDTRVIVTSRFDVPVLAPCRLHAETPETLRDADLEKKLTQLSGLQIDTADSLDNDSDNAIRMRAVKVAAGNPRLLEWLNEVLQDRSLDAATLLEKLAQTEKAFREDVLITELVEAQPSAVRRSLACAALYRLPAPLAAIEALTEDPQTGPHLQSATRVGLVEITSTAEGRHYFVSYLLDNALAEELSDAECRQLAGKASRHQYQITQESRPEALVLEIVRLAVLGQEQAIAVEVGDKHVSYLMYHNRYREAEDLCQQVLRLGEDFRLLTQLARAEQSLGREGTTEHIEKAVSLIPADRASFPDELLKESAFTMSAFADILQARGQLGEALKIREQEQLPVYERLGDVREKAVTMGKIADILWSIDSAKHVDDVRHLLCDALQAFTAMQLPGEAEWVQDKLLQCGLQCEGEINPVLFRTTGT